MDGIPWQVVVALGTPVLGAVGWAGRKIWGLIEAHAERRTKAIEQIPISVEASFKRIQEHVTQHADDHAKAVEAAEQKIVGAVTAAKSEIIDKIALSARLERLEAAAFSPKVQDDPTLPERPDTRPGPSRSGVQVVRDSRPSIATR